ncbi:MAG: two-component sensor histidine kinase [Desulfobulbaceae bacterium]|nr:two-component sensor histidine kinase [Desulfobulbaceae bacterium]
MKNLSAMSDKPFGLVKFFTIATLLVFLIFTPIMAALISNHANQVMLSRSEEYALVFAGNINHQVYDRFVLPSYLRYGSLVPQHPGQQKRLDVIIRNITHGMKVEAVSILDQKSDVVVYSTVSERVGFQGDGGDSYQKAKEGRSGSRLESRGSILSLLPGVTEPYYKLISYIPLRSESQPDQILGVIEIVQDMSDDYRATIRLQGMISGISFLCMFILFVVLRLIVAQADHVIDARARERQVLEDKLRRSEHLANLGKMVATVSHEIKNPLGIIRSTAEMLRKRLALESPTNEQLSRVIVEETIRLDSIVREFLDFARPREMRLQSLAVRELVEEAVKFVAPELERRGISCRLQAEADLPNIQADRELLYRALLNILLNGIQAVEKEGSLFIVLARSAAGGSGINIAISDSGPGIPPELQEQIFKPFYTDKSRGTGLGLAIVKNIIESHQGRIEVSSAPGRGTTFVIRLGQG